MSEDMSKDNGKETVQPWEQDGLNKRERFEVLLRRYNGLVRATEKQNAFVDQLLAERDQLGGDVKRLVKELEAARISSQALGDKINSAGEAATSEVLRLRALLKQHKIEIGG